MSQLSTPSTAICRIRVPTGFELNGAVAACLIELQARAIHQKRWPAEAKLICWTGAVQPEAHSLKRHRKVASMAITILNSLHLPPCSFEVLASGLGSAQALGYQTVLEGDSLQAGLILALVGSGGGPKPLDSVVCTGTIDGGLVGMVGDLDCKIDAAREAGDVWRFIGPRFSGDASLAGAAPDYHDRIIRSRAASVRTMDFTEVGAVNELFQAALSPWSLVRAAQEGNYFYRDPSWTHGDGQDPVAQTAQFIRDGNPQRFRAILAELLREGEWRGVSELLAAHAAMHLRLGRYADGLGEIVAGILRSLTDMQRRRLHAPLVDHPQAMALAALAKGNQQTDALLLLEAVHGRSPTAPPRRRRRHRTSKAIRAEAARVVERACQELSDAHLQEIIDGPLHRARDKFQIPFTLAPSHPVFVDVFTALYVTIGQDTGLVPVWADGGLNTAEVLKLLEECFGEYGGAEAAEAMARYGEGMRPVAERLVEHLRQKLRATHKFGVLKELCDPLDPSMQVECVRALMAQLDGVLPKDLPPAEFLVDRLDVLLRRFVEARDRMTQMLRGL